MGRHWELPQRTQFLRCFSLNSPHQLPLTGSEALFPKFYNCVSAVQGVPGEAGAAGVTGPRVSWRTAFNCQLFRDWMSVKLDADCHRWCAGRAWIPRRERSRRPSGSAGTTRSARNSRNRWTQGEAHISSEKWWIMNSLSPAGGHTHCRQICWRNTDNVRLKSAYRCRRQQQRR